MSLITLSEAKAWLNVDETFTADDTLIQGCIDAAEQWVSKYTNHVFGASDVVISKYTEIYDYPVVVKSATGDYNLETCSLKTVVCPDRGAEVTVTVGYAALGLVPAPLVAGAKKFITYLYENRDIYPTELPFDVQILVNQYRRSYAFG